MSADSFKTRYKVMRQAIIQEIQDLVEAHKRIKVTVEFPEEVFFENGIDEQDSPKVIQTVIANKAIVVYQGDVWDRIKLIGLSTDTLIEILEQTEASLEEAKKLIA